MAKSQFRSKRKVSGTKYVGVRKKRSCDLGRNPVLTNIGSKRVKTKKTEGGNSKTGLLSDDVVLVNDGKKVVKAKIEAVISNPANINYTRRNIITKGSIIKTDKGEVKITSRPGQSGNLQGVLHK